MSKSITQRKEMFNDNFFTPTNYTRANAEAKMIEKGYSDFTFTGSSHTNGSSFYFELSDGRKVRVSDHDLTGKRAFEYIQINFKEVRKIGINRK